MPIQTRSALVAATMTLTLAAGTSLLAPQLVGTALAQASGGGGSGGSVGGAGQGAGSGATQRSGGATDQRGGTATDQRSTGAGVSGGSSDPMNRNRGSGASGSPMSGSSGTDATRTDTMRDRSGTGAGAAESGLVGTEKLTAALGALDGDSATTRRRGGAARNARLIQIEEYETAMRNALAVTDPVARSSAIAEARSRLQGSGGGSVSTDAFARVDSILGLPVMR